jgi:hypothetical protein
VAKLPTAVDISERCLQEISAMPGVPPWGQAGPPATHGEGDRNRGIDPALLAARAWGLRAPHAHFPPRETVFRVLAYAAKRQPAG